MRTNPLAPALTVLSLLWMPLRVRRRGAFGRKASATLRSLYRIVLGVGGWLVGVLIVLTTMPGLPLDDELLAAFSVGVPIGLGLYFSWVNRDWSARTKTTGFAAAAANLTLLALDVAWDRQVRDRFVEASAKETLEARPSTG